MLPPIRHADFVIRSSFVMRVSSFNKGSPPHRARSCWLLLAVCFVLTFPAVAQADFGFPPPSNLTTMQGIIRGVVVTLVVELSIVAVYCYRYKHSLARCLIAGLIGNAITLPMVWICSVMGWFLLAIFGVLVFIIIELAAGMVEAMAYRGVGGLEWRSAVKLGMAVNVITMVMGLVDQAVHFEGRQQPPRPPRRPMDQVSLLPADRQLLLATDSQSQRLVHILGSLPTWRAEDTGPSPPGNPRPTGSMMESRRD